MPVRDTRPTSLPTLVACRALASRALASRALASPALASRALLPLLLWLLSAPGAGMPLADVASSRGLAAPQPPPVEGTVRSTTGVPLPHAQISVVGTGRGTVTDEQGRFTLRGLPAARHRVEVILIGYRPWLREVDVPAAGASVRLEIELEPTALSIPGIQVTATPGGRDAMGVAQATSQLAGRELERRMSGTLAQTLESQPGIGVRYNGPATSAPILRGLTGDRILILQDGQRVSDLSGSADDHSVTVDPLSAQRIEIVRGPASLLYGTNALGGVVNVISGDVTTSVPPAAHWSASLQSESAFPGAAGSVRTTLPLSQQWVLTARAGGRTTGDARIGSDPVLGRRLDNTHHRSGSVAAGLGFAGDALTAGFSLQAYGMEHGVPLPPEEDDEIVLTGRRLTASGNAQFRLGGVHFPALRLQASATDYAHDELEDGDVEMAFALRTLSTDLLLNQAPRGVLGEGAWGASGLFRSYVATGEEQLTAPADSRTFGIFTFQELPLGGAALQAGARVDHWQVASRADPAFGAGVRRDFTALSGSVGVTVSLATGVSLGVSAARSFRAPRVEELFSDALHIGTASYEIGNPDLHPEVARGIDAALRAALPRVSAELSAYLSGIRDFVYFEARGDTVLDGTTWPVLAYTQDRATFGGVEGRVEWEVRPHWVTSIQGDVVRATLSGGEHVPFLPPARVGGGLRFDDGRWSAGAGIRHAFRQDRIAPADEVATDAWTLVDAHLGARFTRAGQVHSLTLRADNLFDALYYDAASRIKSFAPNPGRNVALLYRVYF
jgi:iron complex outermembrane recepter protein